MTKLQRYILMTKLGAKNILLNWRHSLATMFAIAAGFIAVSLFDGFMKSMRDVIYDSYIHRGIMGHVLIEKIDSSQNFMDDPWTYSLNKSDQEFVSNILKQDLRIKAAARFLFVTGLISNGNVGAVFMGVGYDVDEGLKFRGNKWSWNTVAGLPLHLAEANTITLGTTLARRLDCDFDEGYFLRTDGGVIEDNRPFECQNPLLQLSATTEHSQMNALSIKPSGITDVQLREINDKYVSLPLAMAQKLADTDIITRWSVLLKDENQTINFIRDFNKKAKSASRSIHAVEWVEHPVAASGKGGLELLEIFRGLFLTVVSVIVSMSVANTMMKSINERIREVGTLRSFGFRQSDIVFQFSIEGFFLSVLACAGGFIGTLFLSFIISKAGLTFKAGILSTPLPLEIAFAPITWTSSILVLSLLAFGTSYLVSRRVSKMIVADLLRHVA